MIWIVAVIVAAAGIRDVADASGADRKSKVMPARTAPVTEARLRNMTRRDEARGALVGKLGGAVGLEPHGWGWDCEFCNSSPQIPPVRDIADPRVSNMSVARRGQRCMGKRRN